MPASNPFRPQSQSNDSEANDASGVGERMYSSPPHKTPFSAADRTLHSASSDPEPLKQPKQVQANPPTSLPPSFVERGEVLSAEEMTTLFTDEEWEGIFKEVEGEVEEVLKREGENGGGEVRDEEIPGLVDHTLLREDATEEEIRRLCEEAVREGFKVRYQTSSFTSTSELEVWQKSKSC